MVCIKLNAGNDRNGNPRRVYVLLSDTGSIVRAVDEGYEGIHALNRVPGAEGLRDPVEFATTPAEYRQLLREFGNSAPGGSPSGALPIGPASG